MEISVSFRNQLSKVLQRGSLRQVQALAGGDINASFRLDFSEGNPAFLKLNQGQSAHFFWAEADGLAALKASHSLPTPAVLGSGEWESYQYLILEFLRSAPPSAQYASTLGRGLAALHKNSQEQFGWAQDNFIGSLDQPNVWRSAWADFYAECRILNQTKMAFDAGFLESKDQVAIERLLQALNELIPHEAAALVHGDLWSGNVLTNEQGLPVWIDPAVYYGHREMDLAMMQLFGGFSDETFQVYQSLFPLEPGWSARRAYHQLYPLMVHLNLFGASYLSACRQIWKKFA